MRHVERCPKSTPNLLTYAYILGIPSKVETSWIWWFVNKYIFNTNAISLKITTNKETISKNYVYAKPVSIVWCWRFWAQSNILKILLGDFVDPMIHSLWISFYPNFSSFSSYLWLLFKIKISIHLSLKHLELEIIVKWNLSYQCHEI